jgi:hypothetical protein
MTFSGRRRAKTRSTLIIIILASLLCYCVGLSVLGISRIELPEKKPTKTAEVTETPIGTTQVSTVLVSATPSLTPTAGLVTVTPSWTPTQTFTPFRTWTGTPTGTATHTPTITQTPTITNTPLPPTFTNTPLPPTRTNTPVPPTLTDIVPVPSDTPTATATGT